MTDTRQATRQANWNPPGPGSWICDRSHSSAAPTRLMRRMFSEYTEPVYRRAFAEYGAAAGSLDMKFVNGALYRRLVPLIAPDRDKGKLPPGPILWLVARLHPEFRRRERRAGQHLEAKSYLDDIETWSKTERFEWIDRNRELQSVDHSELDNSALADHLDVLGERLIEGYGRHHELHGSDLGPIGDLLAHADGWGLDLTAVMGLLRGSSPATVEAAKFGTDIADALKAAGVDPSLISTIDEIRAVPAAGLILDEYLDLYGWRLISDYDIAGLTLGEMPAAVVAIVRAGASSMTAAGIGDQEPPDASALRARAGDQALFDELLDSARRAYGLRDDNGPITWAWPAGLTRRAYLEAGSRLAADGRIQLAEHVFEFDLPELSAALRGSATPSAGQLVERADERAWETTLSAPDLLGPEPVEPDISLLPPNIRRLMAILLASLTMLEPEVGRPDVPLAGLGIGCRPYVGTARVAHDAGVAVQEMQPGDVLVTPWTAPSFNAVLSIAGGVVVQEGGLLCHAAVMARELGIPAIIGCADAMSRIQSGDLVEIDPEAGHVRIVKPAA